ncbi:hypothetical protein RHECNPAF_750049 [Rhizobium etli CNPAF512]|nr:hypothetical protein RHECNPAF_750049 [Rhizobium etli CNPAF512]
MAISIRAVGICERRCGLRSRETWSWSNG